MTFDIDVTDCFAYLRVLASGQIGYDLRRRIDTSDIIQETLLKAERDKASFRGSTSREFRSWLRSILNNVVLEQVRKHRSGSRDPKREESIVQSLTESSNRLEEWLAAEGISPENVAIYEEKRWIVLKKLAEMEEEERQIIRMKFFEALTLREIATTLGLTINQIAGKYARAIPKLKRVLDAAGLDDLLE